MKAKVKETGEIIEVTELLDGYHYEIVNTNYIWNYRPDELDFNIDSISQKQSVAIEGWVVARKDGTKILFNGNKRPVRNGITWLREGYISSLLSSDSFPDLKWEDEPKKVKITIEEV